MDVNEIKDIIKNLPICDQIDINNSISSRIISKKSYKNQRTANNLFDKYREHIEAITGFDILEDTRRKDVVWARCIVAYTLLMDGFTTVDVGNLMNKDHATVINMKKKVKDALDVPYAYIEEISILNKFKESLNKQ